MFESAGVLYLIAVAFLLILAVLWFFLPFAVFGIQPKIEKVLDELKRTNDLLAEIKAGIEKSETVRPRAGDTPVFRG